MTNGKRGDGPGESRLPPEISATNAKSNATARFAAPDMATPTFSALKIAADADGAPPPQAALSNEPITEMPSPAPQFAAIAADDDDDDKITLLPSPPGNTLLIILAIGGLLAALAAIVFINNQQKQPLCSEQAEWNQYNCRVN